MSHEIELRFHVAAEKQPMLRAWLRRGAALQTVHLQALYFDSPERQLARAGIGLRLRREGDVWVQTVKGPAEDGITRLEHNATLPPGAEPLLDLGRHAGHPLGERLAAFADLRLSPTFATNIQRQRKQIRVPGARIELAWDEGSLLAGERELAVHELELELLEGEPGALLAHAHGLLARLPISLDLRSKAERGENLAGGRLQSPPCKAKRLGLKRDDAVAQSLRRQLLNVFEQIAANASQIGSGSSEAGHLHQLRVGLRRLRALLQLVEGLWPALDALQLEPRAAECARQLGALRDASLPPPADAGLLAAWQAAGGDLLQMPPLPAHDAAVAAAQVRDPQMQRLLLELLGVAQALTRLDWPSKSGMKALLKPRLQDWQRRLRRRLRKMEGLDAQARHEVRKDCKRLRYALELCRGLFDTKAQKRPLAALREAQDRLGELNDLELALAAPLVGASTFDHFRRGWQSARHQALLQGLAPEMARLAKDLRPV